ncbi:MAG: hypothetical protein DMF54_07535 [Acidobacteria bacterium]|nr:MAG: hypothetical protein DMF54_07535 [Acidobacteriota bacterium]
MPASKRLGNASGRRESGHVRRLQGAARARNLGDHPGFRIRRIAQQKVEVLVDSGTYGFEHRSDSVDPKLRLRPASLARLERTRKPDEIVNRRVDRLEPNRLCVRIGQDLHLPAVYAAWNVLLLQRSIDGAAPEENDETARDEDRKSADARADFPRDRTGSNEDFAGRGHDESFSTVWSERRQKEGHASGAKGARSRDG